MSKHKRGIYNVSSKESHRKQLRKSLTSVEPLLWKHLQGRKLAGKKFRQQVSIGPYIVHFYSPEFRLAIELDGARHFTEQGVYFDERRTEYLNKRGVRVIRFENKTVSDSLVFVLQVIAANCIPKGDASLTTQSAPSTDRDHFS